MRGARSANECGAGRQAELTCGLLAVWGFILLWATPAAAIRGGRERGEGLSPLPPPFPPPRPCRVGAPAVAAARRAGRNHVVSGESAPQPAGRGAARGAAPSVCPTDGSRRGGQVNPALLAGCGTGRPFLGSARKGAGRPRAVLPGRGSAPPEGGGRSGPGVPHRSLSPSRGRRTKAGRPGLSGSASVVLCCGTGGCRSEVIVVS